MRLQSLRMAYRQTLELNRGPSLRVLHHVSGLNPCYIGSDKKNEKLKVAVDILVNSLTAIKILDSKVVIVEICIVHTIPRTTWTTPYKYIMGSST